MNNETTAATTTPATYFIQSAYPVGTRLLVTVAQNCIIKAGAEAVIRNVGDSGWYIEAVNRRTTDNMCLWLREGLDWTPANVLKKLKPHVR